MLRHPVADERLEANGRLLGSPVAEHSEPGTAAQPGNPAHATRYSPPSLVLSLLLVYVGWSYFHWLELPDVVRNDSRVNHDLLYASLLALVPFVAIMLYFRLYLKALCGVRVDWRRGEDLYPVAVRTASASIVLTYVLLFLALRHVWGFFGVAHLTVVSLGLIGVVRLL